DGERAKENKVAENGWMARAPPRAWLPRRVLWEMERFPVTAATAPPRPEPASAPKKLASATFVPPWDWLPLTVLPVIARVGVAVVKNAPLPIAPPAAVPTKVNIAVLLVASSLLPPRARL